MKTQKRLASKILKTGTTKVWIDPEMTEEVASAMTRGDIRKYIGLGFIKKKPTVGNSRVRVNKRNAQKAKGRQRGLGKRKGPRTARLSDKEKWMKRIRAQRRFLKKLRDEEKIDTATYRKVYRLAKAGTFKTRAHVRTHLMERSKK